VPYAAQAVGTVLEMISLVHWSERLSCWTLHRVSKKPCKIVSVRSSSNVYQIWSDSTKDRFMWGALIFHLT